MKNDLFPLLRLAIPLSITGLVQSSNWFFESLYLAHLSSQTLAAGSLVSWFFGTLAVILFGILSSVNILVAHKHGGNDNEGIAMVARDGLLLSLVLIVISFIVFWNMSPIFLLFGQSTAVVALAKSYLHALAWGLLPEFVMVTCLEVIVGIGHARVILINSIVAVLLNIIFSYLLIFGKAGFPSLGIAGAGWGNTISTWITAVGLMFYILVHKDQRYYFRYVFTLRKPIFIWELLQIGFPMGVMYCVEVAFFFTLTLLMGTFGVQWQAANQVVMQYLGLLMSIMFAIAQAITVRMGHLLGANDKPAAERAAYMGIFLAIGLAMCMALVYWEFPDKLIAIDFNIDNPSNFEIVTLIKNLFAVSAVFQIIEAGRIAYFGSLRGLKDTHFTLFASITSIWCVALPIGYLLAKHLQFGATGFWWGMSIGAGCSVFLLQMRFRSKMRPKRVVINI